MTPIMVVLFGFLSGVAGSLMFSLLARALPDEGTSSKVGDEFRLSAGTVLLAPVSPGPEGLAEQFAFKWASGVFGKDLSGRAKLAGFLVHLAYGGAWGAGFAIVQASFNFSLIPAGILWGAVVWLIGPIILVPRMKILGDFYEEPWPKEVKILFGHLAYGLLMAFLFNYLSR